MINLENIFKSVTESDFRKSPGLYINNSDRVRDAVCFCKASGFYCK